MSEIQRSGMREWEGIAKTPPNEVDIELSHLLVLGDTAALKEKSGINIAMRALINMALVAAVDGKISLIQLPRNPSQKVKELCDLFNSFLTLAEKKGAWERPFFILLKSIGFSNADIVHELGHYNFPVEQRSRVVQCMNELGILPVTSPW